MSTRRTSWALGSAGVVAGLALGVSGFAQAADPTPAPSGDTQQKMRAHDRGGPHFGMRGDRRGGPGGLVTAIDSDSLTVRGVDGSQTVGLTGSTTYYVGKTKATRSAVEKGAVVHVRLVDPRASKKVAAVVSVLPAHLEGWVTKVGDDSITVTDPGGFTRTIRTGSSTKYVKDGAASTRSAVTVGTFVRATGQVADDGTSLTASRVATGRPSKDDRPGMPGGREGGPGADPTSDEPDDGVGPDGAPIA